MHQRRLSDDAWIVLRRHHLQGCEMTLNIIGAGMAGLLAANMLNRHNIMIHETQSSLPNNHSAVLRFGTEKVSEVLGIPFRKVKMIKTYLPWRNRVADCLAYSMKCTGIARSDRSITSDTFSADRWIAPDDLVNQMARRISANEIFFGSRLDANLLAAYKSSPFISTIPMPTLMKLLEYPNQPNFNWISGKNLRCKIKQCDAFVSMYIPDPDYPFNRISITGDELIAEYAGTAKVDPTLNTEQIAHMLGIDYELFSEPTIKDQTYAKIAPIDNGERKRFLAWATDNFNIYSLGRFATWRPGLMLDDLVHDIRLIERWATADKYSIRHSR